MESRRYLKDYVLRETLGEDGRVRAEGVYVGPVYRLKTEGEALRRARRALALSAAACAAGALVPLLVVSPMLGMWYVLPPLALSLLPAGQLVRFAAVLARKERFTRKERARTAAAVGPWSMALLVLSLLSLAGQAVYAVGGGYIAADAAATAGTVAAAAGAARAFAQRGAFQTEELPRE